MMWGSPIQLDTTLVTLFFMQHLLFTMNSVSSCQRLVISNATLTVLLWRNLSPIAGQTHKKTDVNLLSRSEKLYFTQVPRKTIDNLAPRSVLPSTNHCCFYCCCYCTKILVVNGHFLTPTAPIQCTDEASTGNDFQGKVSVKVSVVAGDKELKVKTKVRFPETRNGVERMGNDAIWIEAFVAHIVTMSP